MSTEDVRRAADAVNVLIGGGATTAVWVADLDMALRIGVSALTMIYLAVAIWHRLRPLPAPISEDSDL